MINQVSFPGLGLEFSLNRVAFYVFGVSVYWYGIIIALGLMLAVVYGMRESKKVGLSQDDLLNMLLISVPTAIICARLYYVIFSLDMYLDAPMSIFDIRSGGLAIYGGVIGTLLAIFFYCRKKKLSLGMVLDVLSIGLLIGQSIGRWGNFVNCEAFGATTSLPWAMTITQRGEIIAQSVHPTFFYESLWNAIGIIVLVLYKKAQSFRGELFCGYLVWYGLGRMWVEGLRADSLYIGPIRVSQLLAIITVLIGGFIIIKNRRKKDIF